MTRHQLQSEIVAAGGVFMRKCKHGDLWRVLGGTILVPRDIAHSVRTLANTRADWRRIQRQRGRNGTR